MIIWRTRHSFIYGFNYDFNFIFLIVGINGLVREKWSAMSFVPSGGGKIKLQINIITERTFWEK